MSAVLPVPSPEPAPALEPQLDRASSPARSIPGDPVPASTAAEWARRAGKGRLLVAAFAVAGAVAAWLSGVLMVPLYVAESRIEIQQTGANPAGPGDSGDSFVATQAQLLTSMTLRRQAVARLLREQPAALYRSGDRLAGLRHDPLAPYLPPAAMTGRAPTASTTCGIRTIVEISPT